MATGLTAMFAITDIDIILTLVVAAVALVMFTVEWLPADITAFGVMVALMLLGGFVVGRRR